MNVVGDIEILLANGKIQTIPANEIKEYFKDKIICNNGAIFDGTQRGILPEVLYEWFSKRVEHSTLRKEYGVKSINATDPVEKEQLKLESDFHDNVQYSLKIMINSMYGLLGTPYSRWYDVDSAEAVTLNGQFIIHTGKLIINNILNSNDIIQLLQPHIKSIGKFNTNIQQNIDYIIAIDTDSLFLNLGKFIKSNIIFYTQLTETQLVDITDKIGSVLEKYLNDKIAPLFDLTMNITSPHPHEVIFKQEIVGSTGIFTTKKRYGIKIKKDNGLVCDKTDVKGLETVRSDIPTFVRNKLKKFLDLILENASTHELLKFIDTLKKEYEKLPVPEQAFPKGVNNIEKYTIGTGIHAVHAKGSPVQVKAAINFNKYILMRNLETKIPKIKSGSKIKWIYLKDNPYGFDTFGFIQWRPEFQEIGQYIDIEKMKEKLIDKKVKSLMQILNITVPKFGNVLDIF